MPKSDVGTSQGLGEQVQANAQQVIDQAQQTAGQVSDQASQQATSLMDNQRERLAGTLVTVSQALRQTGQRLNEQQQAPVARYVERTAEQVERTTNYLRSHDTQEIMADTQQFGRSQPGLFLVGALALGFVGGRFLMSSGRRRQPAFAAGQSPSARYGTYQNQRGGSSRWPSMAQPQLGTSSSAARAPSPLSRPGQMASDRALGASPASRRPETSD